MKKEKTKTYYKKELDKVFSQYIRRKYMRDGYIACYTCGKIMDFSKAQCGHFIPRSNMTTRWDEANCRPQCVGCNMFGGGKYDVYAANLLEEIGGRKFNDLIRKGRGTKQWTIEELKNEIKQYE